MFSWPSNETCPNSFILGGPEVRVLSTQPNATMETNILPEIFNIITKIHLPTVIKIEEVQREEISKALKNFDVKAKKVQVGLPSVCYLHRKRNFFE